MIGRARLKRGVKQTTGWAAALSQPFTEVSAAGRVCIFYYHRIADVGFVDSRVDDWNVTPKQFERQISKLASFAEIIPLLDLPRRLLTPTAGAKPLVCLTFDDGYANFYLKALPILKRYNAPATAFVVTGSMGSDQPLSFDRWATQNAARTSSECWRPLNWKELDACISSGLVTVGAHSHQHLRGSSCSTSQMVEEAETSREILQRRLGNPHGSVFAYPYGNTKLGDASALYVKAVKAAGYQLAVTTDLGLVSAQSDPFTLPRLEAHMVDSPSVIMAKTRGALAPYKLTDAFRGFYSSL